MVNIESGGKNDITDQVYYLNINKKVKTIPAEKIVNNMVLLGGTFDLYYQNTGFLKLQYGRTGIYAVYDSYIKKLTDTTNRKILYDSNYSFLDLVNDRIYLKDKNNDFVSSKVK